MGPGYVNVLVVNTRFALRNERHATSESYLGKMLEVILANGPFIAKEYEFGGAQAILLQFETNVLQRAYEVGDLKEPVVLGSNRAELCVVEGGAEYRPQRLGNFLLAP